MFFMKRIHLLLVLALVWMATSCGTRSGSFEETTSGLKYALHSSSGGETPEMGSILSLEMVYSVGDSTLFDTRTGFVPMYLEMLPPEYPGDIYEGLAMMAPGDSATFMLDAEDFFLYTAGMMEVPPFVNPGDEMTFEVKMIKAMNEDEFAEEQQRIMQEEMQRDMVRAEQEEGLMLEFLEEQGITVQPRESGLYYVETLRGDGAMVEPGNIVSVHYEGRLLDGTVFDSSYEREGPLEFPVGMGQVIQGWDEGISLMRVGGKATLVIPSHLGYGEYGAGQIIPPFTTLVFDVELVDVQNQ